MHDRAKLLRKVNVGQEKVWEIVQGWVIDH